MGTLPLGSALGSALGAVFVASQKPHIEATLQQLHASLSQIPSDINWLQFQQGVTRYMAQPARAPRTQYPLIAKRGRVTLRHAGGDGSPLVIIPSMVNKGYVLDLHPNHSMVQHFRNQGYTTLIIDWGEPDPTNPLTLETLIAEHLEPLLQHAHSTFGPIHLFGYCMGGLLALAAAVRLGTPTIRTLATAAMPWDFSVTPTHGNMAAARAAMLGAPTASPTPPQLVTASAMQMGFFLLDPWSPIRRLMAYATTPTERLPFMTALEDWLADGLALDGPIAQEMLMDWYADNRTLKGQWKIQGTAITPSALTMPWWACVCQRDVLVPTLCALPAIAQGKLVTTHLADTGHVGLVCGRKASDQLFHPYQNWLQSTSP